MGYLFLGSVTVYRLRGAEVIAAEITLSIRRDFEKGVNIGGRF
jgi:hypothetical protein